jgi:arsenate reductase
MDKTSGAAEPAVIYHNPACGTSRKALEALRAAGLEPIVVDYLNDPPDRNRLETLLKRMGRSVRDILRKRGTPYEELGLDRPDLDDDAIFAAIARHPILIERPIVSIGARAALCRPAEIVNELIAAGKS